MLEPGSTIGILGGGQLGRMMALASAQLGYSCHIFAPEEDSVAAEVAAHFTCADWHDGDALARFAGTCDVITYEFENVPAAPLEPIADKLFPTANALGWAQDRLSEKRFVASMGGSPAPFAEVNSRDDLAAAMARIGTPGILKTCRDGYDGKGQWRFRSTEEAAALALPQAAMVYEGFVEFEAEFSVILVRGHDGEIRFWDSTQNDHTGGMLASSTLPACNAILSQLKPARALASQVAEQFAYVGVLTLEFFATAEGPVFNEMAPRVHNSGHWTVEGAVTSQFENHIRAICGLPLGDTASIAPQMVMRNLIGDDVEQAVELLRDPANHLHLYGKSEVREGRKMGHVTRLGPPATN
ncbi:5-(carboxyamino)imidazole ribonucleotide synthase [Altererythrobacter sp. CAU 1778]